MSGFCEKGGRLRFPSRALSHPFFGWEGSPTQIDFILTSILEDLGRVISVNMSRSRAFASVRAFARRLGPEHLPPPLAVEDEAGAEAHLGDAPRTSACRRLPLGRGVLFFRLDPPKRLLSDQSAIKNRDTP